MRMLGVEEEHVLDESVAEVAAQRRKGQVLRKSANPALGDLAFARSMLLRVGQVAPKAAAAQKQRTSVKTGSKKGPGTSGGGSSTRSTATGSGGASSSTMSEWHALGGGSSYGVYFSGSVALPHSELY